jgi:hypothetical protein
MYKPPTRPPAVRLLGLGAGWPSAADGAPPQQLEAGSTPLPPRQRHLEQHLALPLGGGAAGAE